MTETMAVGRAMSHRGDPVASDLNADALNKSGAVSRQAKAVFRLIRLYAAYHEMPATAKQIARTMCTDYYRMQRRLCDLERAGKIRREKEPVKCPVTGRPAHRIDLAGGA